MALTPNEILNKEFNAKFRGYDADQVNDYLDIIVADFETMIADNAQLRQELAAAKEKNEYFAQLQDSLNSSIVVAQEAADRLKQNARKEAELILYEAEREADRMINNASDTAKNIVTESDALRRSSKSYRAKLEQMIRHQLDVVSSEEYHRLFDEEIESKFNPDHFHEAANQRVQTRVERLEQENVESVEEFDQEANEYPVDFDLGQENLQDTHAELSREELHSAVEEDVQPEATDFEALHAADLEREKRAAERKESVLGQTIRIELPKD